MLDIRTVKKYLILIIFVGQCLFQGVVIPGVGVPVYLACLILLALVTLFSWGKSSGLKIKKKNTFAIVAILLNICIVFAFIINWGGGLDRILLISTSFLFCLACYDVAEDKNDVKWFINLFIITAFASSIVEIGQVCGVDFCFSLWSMTHQGERILSTIVAERYMGLSPTILHFAYFISAACILTIFYKFKRFNVIKKSVLFTTFAIALVTNNTRSSILMVLVAVIIWLFTVNKANKKFQIAAKLLVSLILLVGTWYIFSKTDIYSTSRFNSNEGFDLRITMFLTAFNHMLHYPLGMGNYTVQSDLLISQGNVNTTYVQSVGAHNLFANCAACYGIIGLLLLIALYVAIIKKYAKIRVKNPIITGIFLGIISLWANSCVHNLYILSGDLMSFFLMALLLKCSDKTSDMLL